MQETESEAKLRLTNQSREITQLLEETSKALRQIYGNRLRGLYLFGSYATQKASPGSDVDVVIVLKDFRDYWEEVKRTSHVISALSLQYDISVSPIRLREDDWLHSDSPFLNNLRKEAIAL